MRHRFPESHSKTPLRAHLSPPPTLQTLHNPLFGPNPRYAIYPLPTNGSAGGKQPSGKTVLGSPFKSFSVATR
jgi:hypothetical protein